MIKPHTSDKRITYDYIRVNTSGIQMLYEWHTNGFGNDIKNIKLHNKRFRAFSILFVIKTLL